jgi:hypothetical protein
LEGAGDEVEIDRILEVVDEECFGGEVFEIFSEVSVSGASSEGVGVSAQELFGLVVGALDDAEDAPVGVLVGGVSEELSGDTVELVEEGLESFAVGALGGGEACAQLSVVALEAVLDRDLLVPGDLRQQRGGRFCGIGQAEDGAQLVEESLALAQLGQQWGDDLVVGDGSAQLEELVDLAGQSQARLESEEALQVGRQRQEPLDAGGFLPVSWSTQ